MSEERWVRRFTLEGREFEASFERRPFREGFEVQVELDGEILTLAELGLGEQAAIERLKAEIQKRIKGA